MFSVFCGDILVWIAGFGFSDLLCDYLNIKTKKQRFMYYLISYVAIQGSIHKSRAAL